MHPELAPETEDLNVLGIRDIDLQYRRDAHLGLYTHPHFHNGTYWPEYIGVTARHSGECNISVVL